MGRQDTTQLGKSREALRAGRPDEATVIAVKGDLETADRAVVYLHRQVVPMVERSAAAQAASLSVQAAVEAQRQLDAVLEQQDPDQAARLTAIHQRINEARGNA